MKKRILYKIKVLLSLLRIWIIADEKYGRLRFAQFIENYHSQINDPYYLEDTKFLKSLLGYYKK